MYHSSQLARAKLGDSMHGMLMDVKSRQGMEEGKVMEEDTPHQISLEKDRVVDPNRFVHTNMTPFFGGKVK
jgi:hypothetical protein